MFNFGAIRVRGCQFKNVGRVQLCSDINNRVPGQTRRTFRAAVPNLKKQRIPLRAQCRVFVKL